MNRIITKCDNSRKYWNCDRWIAIFDNYDGIPIDHETPSADPIGFGRTEQEAIDNLLAGNSSEGSPFNN